MKANFTHKGWFFMCPIYLSPDDAEMPVEARYAWLEWWFTVQEYIFAAMVFVCESMNPEYEPMFPFYVTGELSQ